MTSSSRGASSHTQAAVQSEPLHSNFTVFKPLGTPRLRAAWGRKKHLDSLQLPICFFLFNTLSWRICGSTSAVWAAALQVWYCATDFHPHQCAQNKRTGGRLIWWCNHWRWHLEFNHKLIASFKQLKIYSQSKKHSGCQVRRLVLCLPAMPLPLRKACFWLRTQEVLG